MASNQIENTDLYCKLCYKIFEPYMSMFMSMKYEVCRSCFEVIVKMSKLTNESNKQSDLEKPGECMICRKLVKLHEFVSSIGSMCDSCSNGTALYVKFINLKDSKGEFISKLP